MTNIETLPSPKMEVKPRSVTLSVEALSYQLADAETMGGHRAMQMKHDETERVIYLCEQAITREVRARLWEANIRGYAMKERGL